MLSSCLFVSNDFGLSYRSQAKIEAAELTINQKTQNLRRLEAQRNALNARGTPMDDIYALLSLFLINVNSSPAPRRTSVTPGARLVCW